MLNKVTSKQTGGRTIIGLYKKDKSRKQKKNKKINKKMAAKNNQKRKKQLKKFQPLYIIKNQENKIV